MASFVTDQEEFWAGQFGDDYVDRNRGQEWVASNAALFAQILRSAGQIGSVLELGANVGLNLMGLRGLLPNANLAGVEINAAAAAELERLGYVEVHAESILDFSPARRSNLVFTKGVLIHLHPDVLPQVYDLMYNASDRYVMMAEYYNPSPMTMNYRGHEGRLFKRDFAGEFMSAYPDVKLVSYGFAYHADANFPQDDLTWFLMEKSRAS